MRTTNSISGEHNGKMVNVALAYARLFCFLLIFSGCRPEKDPEPDKVSSLLTVPAHFKPYRTLSNNPTTKAGVKLGRQLFFETLLSGNNRISCATCHQQQKAFTDGLALGNLGLSGNFLHRNSPALINLAWAEEGLFWDGGATNLESLSIGPITHLDEMGLNILELPAKLGGNQVYQQLFKDAFPLGTDQTITTQKTLMALAQYIRTLVSAGSKYDRFITDPQANLLTGPELEGLAVFDAKCASCHSRDQHLFTDNHFHNIGLDDFFSPEGERQAQGRYRITFRNEDMGKFKTPTLRNLVYTAPYMHDGRFNTLEQVLDHFSTGIKPSPTLAEELRQMTLSGQEKKVLLAFLSTLNDPEFVNNALYRP